MRALLALFSGALFACSSSDSSPCDPCTVPGAPAFAGVTSVAPAREAGTLRVTWTAATDDDAKPSDLRYRIYGSTHSGVATTRAPVLTTEPGATSAVIVVSPPEAVHYVVVHAVDPADHEDENSVEKSAAAVADVTPPTFAGLKTAAPAPDGGIKLAWDPGSDDLTPVEGLRYGVYGGRGEVSFAAPLAVVQGVSEAELGRIGADGERWKFAVRAIDAADNTDSNQRILEQNLGGDTEAPAFAGCSGVVARGSNGLVVTWPPATDDTPASDIAYEIYVSQTKGGQDFENPTVTVVGETTAIVRKLAAATPYFVVCRARDLEGNQDTNTTEKTATTTSNTKAPTFAGLTAATLDPVQRSVVLDWAAATDDVTPPAQLVYEAFQATATGKYDFTAPVATSKPGATTMTLTELPSATTLFWVVRARDADYNYDANTAERSGTTNVSFSLDIQPVFTHNCAVVGCHTSALPMAGMALSEWSAYDEIVNVSAVERPGGMTLNRITPNDTDQSYLYRKILGPQLATIVGSQMPAPGTGNTLSAAEKDLIKKWIEQGAPRN